MRINKFLSKIGYCSRREADKLIKAKKIYVNKEVADLGTILKEDDKIFFKEKEISTYKEELDIEEVVLALNKPRGVVCTSSKKDRATNIVEYVNYKKRVYPIGRLDKDSQGLIFLSNIGELVNALMKPNKNHEKEYEVFVDKDIDKDFLEKMSVGIYLKDLNRTTKKCKLSYISKRCFRITLTEGLNRQIRRMCKSLGYTVLKLNRLRIMNFKLDNLEYGKYRELSKIEIEKLKKEVGI